MSEKRSPEPRHGKSHQIHLSVEGGKAPRVLQVVALQRLYRALPPGVQEAVTEAYEGWKLPALEVDPAYGSGCGALACLDGENYVFYMELDEPPPGAPKQARTEGDLATMVRLVAIMCGQQVT
jgi:hypothetical protein